MNNFEFYNPTRILFGPGQISQTGRYAARYGKRALIVTTRNAVKKLGILDKVRGLLESEGLIVFELSGVDPNPRLSTVYRGAGICREEKIDVVVALGGGERDRLREGGRIRRV
jgi:hypothetical protein